MINYQDCQFTLILANLARIANSNKMMSMQECTIVYKNKWSLLFHGDQDSSYFVREASGKIPADKD